ncbi:MAG: hypothetical protein K8T89_23580, partial [Planctomycetes bacterium]|nr:hypothetical protein [Planctomycetota bacterium]
TLTAANHPVDLFEPSSGSPRGVLIYLHGEDCQTLASNDAATALLETHRLACLCPHGGPFWWADRQIPAFDGTLTVERWLMELVWKLATDYRKGGPIALCGSEMGGQGALRLAFKHPTRFPIVGAIDAAIDHHERYGEGSPLDDMYPSREHCRQDSATLHIHPARQPTHIWFAADPASEWYRGNDRLHEKLTALGVNHTFSIKPCVFEEMLRTIVAAIQQESRRLL